MPTQRSLHASPKGDRAGVLRHRDGPALTAQRPAGPAVPPGPSTPAATPVVAPTAARLASGTLASAAAPVSRLASTSRARWCEVCGVRCGWRVALGGGLVRGRSVRPHVGIAAGLGRRQRSHMQPEQSVAYSARRVLSSSSPPEHAPRLRPVQPVRAPRSSCRQYACTSSACCRRAGLLRLTPAAPPRCTRAVPQGAHARPRR